MSWSIATWNVNSLRARLPRVLAWLERHGPDVLALQETKCADEDFPRAELEGAGYQVAFAGEPRGLNGVALLTRRPLTDVRAVLPGREDDDQRRFLSGEVDGVRVIDVYVPNGQAIGSDAFFFKLDWLSRLSAHLREEHDPAQPLVLLGDFNITPDDRDVCDPAAWKNHLHCTAVERKMLGYLGAWGLKDALRELTAEGGLFSWFDYRGTTRRLKRDEGLRIDLIYLTAPLAARLEAVEIDWEEREGERPSDHAPVVARLRGADSRLTASPTLPS
ncbi:MAG: exodeoxyribonuclease III [Planctomycetota bacterium]